MISPEQAQKLYDLRARMLENVKHDRPSHEGITEDEIKEGLSFVRQNRAIAAERGGKASAKKRTKKPAVELDLSAFGNLNLD